MASQPAPGNPDLAIDLRRPSDMPEMCRMLALTFAHNDPPAVAVGLTPAEFEVFVRLVAAPETTRQLTLVARDPASGALAGAMLTEDAASAAPDGMADLSPKFDPIFGLFGLLDAQLPEQPAPPPGEVLHLFLLGVDDPFAGRGVAQRLVRETLDRGVAMGYRSAVAKATNRTSQHIFIKAGFAARARTSYAAYRHDGIPVFASVADHGGPWSMRCDLRTDEEGNARLRGNA